MIPSVPPSSVWANPLLLNTVRRTTTGSVCSGSSTTFGAYPALSTPARMGAIKRASELELTTMIRALVAEAACFTIAAVARALKVSRRGSLTWSTRLIPYWPRAPGVSGLIATATASVPIFSARAAAKLATSQAFFLNLPFSVSVYTSTDMVLFYKCDFAFPVRFRLPWPPCATNRQVRPGCLGQRVSPLLLGRVFQISCPLYPGSHPPEAPH